MLVTLQTRDQEIRSTITALEPLAQPDESLFAVVTPTAAADQIHMVQISEDSFNKLVIGGTKIDWPSVAGGPAKGGCGVFVSADRSGNIREAFEEGCDNAGLEEPVRQAALKWKLQKAEMNGARVQVQALLGIPFEVQVTAPPPDVVLPEAEARKLATNTVEPKFPRGTKSGTQVQITIKIDDDGRLLDWSEPQGTQLDLFRSAVEAVHEWKFGSYLKAGKPVPFKTSLTFTAP
jgi:hypothetical protein